MNFYSCSFDAIMVIRCLSECVEIIKAHQKKVNDRGLCATSREYVPCVESDDDYEEEVVGMTI